MSKNIVRGIKSDSFLVRTYPEPKSLTPIPEVLYVVQSSAQEENEHKDDSEAEQVTIYDYEESDQIEVSEANAVQVDEPTVEDKVYEVRRISKEYIL